MTMTIRDEFAAAAMQGLLAEPTTAANTTNSIMDSRLRTGQLNQPLPADKAIAYVAYQIADAMIHERAKWNGVNPDNSLKRSE